MISLSASMKKKRKEFDRACTDSIDQFRENCHLNDASLPIHEHEIALFI